MRIPPSMVGRDPNEGRAQLLQDSLQSFKEELSRVSSDRSDKEDLLETMKDANGESLLRWFEDRNRTKSCVNILALQRIIAVFDLFIATNQSMGASKYNLNELYGAFQCSIMAGSTICENIRPAAMRLESIGPWFPANWNDEPGIGLLPPYVVWDYLAWFCTEVVQFCTKIVRCENMGQIYDLVGPTSTLQDIWAKMKDDMRKREQDDITHEQQAELRKKQSEEAKKRRDEEIKATREWIVSLSGTSRTDRHAAISALRHDRTGKWFVEKVIRWLHQNQQKTLWAEGKPGAGKSVLMSTLVKQFIDANRRPEVGQTRKAELQASENPEPQVVMPGYSNTRTDGTTNAESTCKPAPLFPTAHPLSTPITATEYSLAYIYFAFDERGHQEPLAIYAQILRQLYGNIKSLHEPLCKLRIECSERRIEPAASRLFELIRELPETVLLALDALDEASSIVREDLCGWIESMEDTSPRLLVTTRTDVPKPNAPSNCLTTMVVEASDEDVTLYARSKIENNTNVQHVIKKTLRSDNKQWIEDRVSEILMNAQKVFLLVRLRVDDFCSQLSVKEMKVASAKIDNDPGQIYSRTLLQIKTLPEHYVKSVFMVLAWLTFSKATMDPEQIAEALAIEPGTYFIDPEARVYPESLIEFCRGLVILDNRNGYHRFRLAHQTVQEHFSTSPELTPYREHICCALFTYLTYASRPSKGRSDWSSSSSECSETDHLRVKDQELAINGSENGGEDEYEARSTRIKSDSPVFHREGANYSTSSLAGCHQQISKIRHDDGIFEEGSEAEINNIDTSNFSEHEISEITRTHGDANTTVPVRIDGDIVRPSSGFEDVSAASPRRSVQTVHDIYCKPGSENDDGSSEEDDFYMEREMEDFDGAVSDWSIDDYPETQYYSIFPMNLSSWVRRHEAALSFYAGKFALAHLNEIDTNPAIETVVNHFVLEVFARRQLSALVPRNARDPREHFGMKLSHLAAYIGLTKVMASVIGHPDFQVDAKDNLGRTAFAWSLYLGKPEIARLLLSAGANPNEVDKNGDATVCFATGITDDDLQGTVIKRTNPENLTSRALRFAVLLENDTLLDLLLKEGISPEYGEDGKSNSALHDAVAKRRESMIIRLLAADAKTSTRNGRGQTALAMCCQMSLPTSAYQLLKAGADPTITDEHLMTSLHYAAARCDKVENGVSLIKCLIHAKANPAAEDKYGRTPLIWYLDRHRDASKEQVREAVECLCPNNSVALCQPSNKITALHLAAQWHKSGVVRYLANLTNGWGLDAVDSKGRSPLLLLFQRKDVTTIKRVLALELKGALDLVYQNRSILDEAIALGDIAIVQKLLNIRPTLLTNTANLGHTALFTAARHDQTKIFRLLLRNGVDPKFCHSSGNVVLHEICRLGRLEMAETLIDMRAWASSDLAESDEPVLNAHGDTILHSTAESSSAAVLEVVLKRCGLDVNEDNLSGDRPLHICTRHGTSAMIRMLLKAKADVNAMNNAGKTALDLALEREDASIIGELLSFGAFPALFWPVEPIERKWAKMNWSSDLAQAISHGSESARNRFACDSRWAMQRFKCKKRAFKDEDSKDVPYLEIRIPGSGGAPVRRIVFKTVSHDQGYSHEDQVFGNTYQNSWTWFEAAVHAADQLPSTKAEYGSRRVFQYNVHALRAWRTHTNIWDYRDPEPGLRSWLGLLRSGDTLGIYPKALFRAWGNYVKRVEVEIYYENSLTFGNQAKFLDTQLSLDRLFAPRVVVYFQTHHHKDGKPVSLRPLVDNHTGVTHVIVAAFHLNERPGDITLNDDEPDAPKNMTLWRDVSYLQNAGVKIMAMLGGAAKGTFKRLDIGGLEFVDFYKPLRDLLQKYYFDGIDLDVEEHMSPSGIKQLIDQLRLDFGNTFLISLAPVSTAMVNGPNLSRFDYELLELRAGHLIDWYNVQLYCGWSDPGDQMASIRAILIRGWPLHKIVLGQSTNPNTPGFVDCNVLDNTLEQLRSEMMDYPAFGGVMGWEYFDSFPGGTAEPWLWAKRMSESIKRHWYGEPATRSDAESGNKSAPEQIVNVELESSEIVKIADSAVNGVVAVEMRITENAAIVELAHRDEPEEVVSMEMKVISVSDSGVMGSN